MGIVVQIPRADATRPTWKIGDLARHVHKSTRALRLYEDLGLLGPAVRTEGGHRLYTDDALVRLSWIDKLQLLGFSLHEIRSFLDELAEAQQGPQAMHRVKAIFEGKLREVQAQVQSLNALADEIGDSLKYLETCAHTCDPSTLLSSCRACGHDHTVEPPTLIAGIHKGGEES
jgi:MerR family transcriptional regulator, copper efflux regulator